MDGRTRARARAEEGHRRRRLNFSCQCVENDCGGGRGDGEATPQRAKKKPGKARRCASGPHILQSGATEFNKARQARRHQKVLSHYPVPVHTTQYAGWRCAANIYTWETRPRPPTCLINHVKLANNPRSLNPILRPIRRESESHPCDMRAWQTGTRIGRPTTKGEEGARPRDDTNQCGRNNKGASLSLSLSLSLSVPPERRGRRNRTERGGEWMDEWT